MIRILVVALLLLLTVTSDASQNKPLIYYLTGHIIDQAYQSDQVVGLRYQDYQKKGVGYRKYFAIMRDRRKHRSIEFYTASPPPYLLQSVAQQTPALQSPQFQANQIMAQAQEALMSTMMRDSDGGQSFFNGAAQQPQSWGNASEMDALLQGLNTNAHSNTHSKQYVKVNVQVRYWDGDVVKTGRVWYTIDDGNNFFVALDNGFFVAPKIK